MFLERKIFMVSDRTSSPMNIMLHALRRVTFTVYWDTGQFLGITRQYANVKRDPIYVGITCMYEQLSIARHGD